MRLIGKEQIHNPQYSIAEKLYISVFGMPIIGLRIRARNVFSLIPKNRKYRRILDAGSGPGVFSFELGRRIPKGFVLGVLKESVNACQHIAKKIKSDVKFRQTSVEELSEKNFFDLIICVDILEHIKNDLAALIALHRVASHEGLLILHVPALYRRYPVWKKSPNFDVETHVRTGYEPKDIVDKVKKAGFIVRESGFTYGFWETLANNLSYMITRARMENKIFYSLVFPILNLISLIGAKARPSNLGAGVYIIAEKKETHETQKV